MRSLWFKRDYAHAILRGEKRDTVRRPFVRLAAGDVVAASVGPRRPFALLRVTAVEPYRPDRVTPEHRAAVDALYGAHAPLERVWFCVVQHLDPVP